MQTTSKGTSTVKIYIDYAWHEYTVVLVGSPKATYHTNDRLDAIDTARAMLDRAFYHDWDPSHAHS